MQPKKERDTPNMMEMTLALTEQGLLRLEKAAVKGQMSLGEMVEILVSMNTDEEGRILTPQERIRRMETLPSSKARNERLIPDVLNRMREAIRKEPADE